MKYIIKGLLASAAFASLGLAHADDFVTLNAGLGSSASFLNGLANVSQLSGSATLTASGDFIGALNAVGIQTGSQAPAILSTRKDPRGSYLEVSAQAPLSQLGLQIGNGPAAITSVSSLGGISYVAEDDAYSTSGGTLSISNLKVDFSAHKVYATLDGGNGVGHLDNFYLWDVSTVTGATSFFAYQEGVRPLNSTLSGLVLNAQALDVLSTSLGLLDAGRQAFSSVTDFGTINLAVSVNVDKALDYAWPNPVSDVPEPSAWALMLVGLTSLGLSKRRQNR